MGEAIATRPTAARPGSFVCVHTHARTLTYVCTPGVGTQGGAETVTHALESALAEDPETVVISLDMANAFNSIHRASMFVAVQQSAPALLLRVQWAYGEDTPLHTVGTPEGTRHVTAWSGAGRPLGSAAVRAHAAATAGEG